MFSQFFLALGSFGQAIPFLSKSGFRNYLLIPILLNLGLLTLAIWASVEYGAVVTDYILGLVGLKDGSLAKYMSWIVSFIIRFGILMIYFSLFRYILLILLSPFLSFLSEKVERHEKGTDFPFSLRQMGSDIIRAIVINGQNLGIEILLTLVLSVFAFIPIVGLISPFAILAVQSYFFGFAIMDYNPERHKWTRKQTSAWMRKNYAGVTAIGLAFHLCFLVPILGWIVAPVLATIAGTLSFLRIRRKEENFPAV